MTITIPEKISQLYKPFTKEFQRACDSEREKNPLSKPQKTQSLTLEQYREILQSTLNPKDFPSEENLQKKLNEIAKLAKEKSFKDIFPTGTDQKILLCLAYFPLDGNGYPVEDERFNPLKQLVIIDGLTYGFTPTPAYYFELLPEKIQECTFIAPDYASNWPFPTEEELKKVQTGYESAYRKLMAALEK